MVDWCLKQNVTITPGVATPTDITQAVRKGLDVLKFFPAEVLGGRKALKSIAGPFFNVKFIPTGGINADNLGDYLRLPMVFCCCGSWLVNKNLISGGRFDEIERLTREALDIVKQVRARE